jgi:hypothetical protein
MQELRFVAVSEDGRYAVLAVPGRSARFTLPIDERLRAVALGQTSRLVQYEIEVESPLRPKEIQARIRAGETVEEIADAAGIAVERVRWFEGPVLAERAYAAEQAQTASVRRLGDAAPSTPGPSLGEIVTERLKMFGSDPEDAQWDAKKRGDGSWQVELMFISGGRLHTAEWVFDPRRRHVLPADDNAARMSLPGTEPPQPAAPPPGEATVTQLAPRLSTASGQGVQGFGQGAQGAQGAQGVQPANGISGFGPAAIGNGGFGNGGPGNAGSGHGGRLRHERPGAVRPAVSEPAASVSSAPSRPAPSVPETWADTPRSPAPGRHSLPRPASEETAQEPTFIETDSGRNGFSDAAEPAAARFQAPEAPLTEASDSVSEVSDFFVDGAPDLAAEAPDLAAEALAPAVEAPAAVSEAPDLAADTLAPAFKAPAPATQPPAAVTEAPASVSEAPALGTGSPAAEAPSTASAPSPSPATIAAQVSRAAQAPKHGRESGPARDVRAPQPRQETTPAAASPASPAAAAAAAPAASMAEEPKAQPAATEPGTDQAGRQGRKTARGKRSSVPSWDEIMFGNSRQRD